MIPLSNYLLLAAILFSLGLLGVITRRSAIGVLIGIEMMLNAANLNLVAFWRYGQNPELLTGPIFTLFSMAVAGAEVAVGLALIILLHRHFRGIDVDRARTMKG